MHPGRTFSVRKLSGAAGAIVYDFAEDSRTFSWTAGSQALTAVESAMSFRLAGHAFVLVRWKASEHPLMCEFAYTLCSLDGSLQPIAGNAYGCDV